MSALKAGRANALIVISRYYEHIAAQLLAGATAALDAADAGYEVVEAPGALEIPAVIAMALEAARFTKWTAEGRYQGAVALGCVIRGETSHYDIVAGESARALMDLSVAHRLPFGNGVLTVENERQALERADPAGLNKGGDAANACLAMIAVKAAFARAE
ncbi:MAG: 6,7-dimethyl-8-ribityllumazine synthase [Hyphomicrobiales bacterium]|nr:6,7-dimethyl-8-ribityllumazine synthase [Hyphomicrobiales bacterium]